MSHSHLPVQHLLKNLETFGIRPRRDVRPAWLADLINQIAELFEPFTDVGRVGFDCRLTDDRWELGMFLGSTELVGGKEDGDVQHVDFQLDIARLHSFFTSIDHFTWSAFPGGTDCDMTPGFSFISIDGCVQNHPLRLRVFSTPPDEAGPGLRRHSDGTWEPV